MFYLLLDTKYNDQKSTYVHLFFNMSFLVQLNGKIF